MKLLTDFDGVWTDPREEAALGYDFIIDEVCRITGADRETIQARISSIRDEVLSQPLLHGWESNGAIAAFSEEDPYITNNAICRAICLYHSDLWDQLKNDFSDFDAFSYSCYRGGVQRYSAGKVDLLRKGAKDVLRSLLSKGWEIVYASNSTGEKLRSCLGELSAEEGGPIRIRGSARKFVLTSEVGGSSQKFAKREVRTDRGHYLEILEEEKPDIIVGDVFSLDLSLPAELRAKGIPYLEKGLVLYKTEYTPSWALEAAQSTPGISIVGSLREFESHLTSIA
jgi:hypothetical protein